MNTSQYPLFDTPVDAAICIQTVRDYVEYLYGFLPETSGRYVPSYAAWVTAATPIWVAQSIVHQFNKSMRRVDTIMAAKKTAKKETPRIEYEFVRGELTSDQKAAAKIWIDKHGSDLEILMGDVIASEHKISLSYDDYNDTFVASITGKPENAYNAGKILTGRGKTWYLAIMSALFKHHVIFDLKAWSDSNKADDGDFS
jgi:hypothetical protein